MRTFDVVVVGGGLIGSAIAFELAGQKLRVAILDRQQPGREASWAAAGMLSPGPDSPAGLALVPLGKESLRLYPDFVSAIEEASGKTVAFTRQGTLEIFDGPDGSARRDRLLAQHAELGLPAEVISGESARSIESALNPGVDAIAWLPGEAVVDPRLLVDATLAAATNRGVEILASCAATAVLGEADCCTGVIVGGQKIASEHVVIAAGSFCGSVDGDSAPNAIRVSRYAPTQPIRGQMIAMRSSKVKLKRVLRSEHGYIVPRTDGRIIAGSTLENAGFVKDTTATGLQSILDAAVSLAPGLANAEILETWAGLRPGTPDHLPIIGPADIRGLLVATGHYRNGILLAPVTAKLIREWMVDGKTTFSAERFSPLRFSETSRAASAKTGTARS